MKVNRRAMLSLLGVSPAVLAGSAAAKEHNQDRSISATQVKLEGLNPHGMPPAIQLVPMAPRLTSLDNKTIYLVSDGFPGVDGSGIKHELRAERVDRQVDVVASG